MKIKLTVSGMPSGDTDVLLTADVTATIGEIARNIVLGHPDDSPLRTIARGNLKPLALRAWYPNNPQSYVLDPLATLSDAGLQSGCAVEVIAMTDLQADDVPLYRRAAMARISAGPQAGSEFDLVVGKNYIGRGRGCRIQLEDPTVSRRHAALDIRAGMSITDLNSENGVLVDGVKVDTAKVEDGSTITIGDTEIAITRRGIGLGEPELKVPSAFVEFVRSPRVDAHYLSKKIAAPVPPRRGEPNKFPILAIIAPLAMGVVLFSVSHSALSLIFVALSPVIMIGTYIDNRVTGRRKLRDGVKQFDAALKVLETKVTAERELELASRTIESPSTLDAYQAMVGRAPLLWARRPEHQTFLEVRLGLGEQQSRIGIDIPARNDAGEEFWGRLDTLVEASKSIAPVPVLEKFDRAGNIGVAGSRVWSDGVLRSLVIQLCGLHSPADLVITCFAEPDNYEEWRWLKWLPHVGSVYSPITSSHLAGDGATSIQLIAQLEGVLESRQAARAASGGTIRSHLSEDNSIDDLHGRAVQSLPVTPTIIVVVTSDSQIDRGRLVTLADQGPDVGIHLIWHAPEVADLPAVCRTFIDVQTDSTSIVGFVRSGSRVTIDVVESLPMAEAATAARGLSPVLDSGAPVLDESDLPSNVSYQDLRPQNVIGSADDIAALWASNQSLTSRWATDPPREAAKLSAIVGQGVNGVLRLDLRENGPHALVGGTTGSGKSEFLQSWIMSLASEYSPDRLNFLLVDYKGGAAFAECTDLPHTVGLVTDLNTHLVRRALTSLRAELHYRETLLNEKGAKDLVMLERRADPDAPPSLVIVIDEFAALVGEVPEFVDGVVDVAQRGRSLGLHLIMATQRPAGVIKDNLRANTPLRIALRVADESDSQDVIGAKDAAAFDASTPGRGAAKLGPGKLIHFQTGYLGGRSQTAAPMPDIDIADFPFELRESWTSGSEAPAARKAGKRDIETMLHSVQAAAKTLKLATPRKPWLGQLLDIIDLDSLPAARGHLVTLGLQDEPERQRQTPFVFDPEGQGNLSVLGTSGSGKSSALRTLAVSASRSAATLPVQIYAIDFAGGALSGLAGLPTVGSVVLGDDGERVQRLIRMLSDIADERAVRYPTVAASTLSEYRANSGDPREPRIFVLIDGMANFRSSYEYRHGDNTFQSLVKLMAMGRQLGLHFVVSADRPGVIPSSMSGNIQQNIVLRMASQGDYGILGSPADVFEDAPAGRAFVDGHEAHLAVVAGSSSLADQVIAIENLSEDLRAQNVTPTSPIERLADSIELSSLPVCVGDRPVIGVADEDLQAASISPDGLLVVTGPFRSGKTTAVKTVIESVARASKHVDAILLSPKTASELDEFGDWTSTALGASDVEPLARDLATSLTQGGGAWPKRGALGFIVVESAGDFEGSTAEGAVAALIKAARKANVLIVVETDLATGPAAWQIYSELKTARAGIVLQPEETDGVSLFRVSFPRGTRSEFPEGRGYLVEAGRATKLQVALPRTRIPTV
jgi:DNA segregation ATPase FtsK/SpoIIIE, S-DNA-T family